MQDFDDYAHSRFAAAYVPPPPKLLVELLEERTGAPYPRRLIEEYERVRAYTAYVGVRANNAPEESPPAWKVGSYGSGPASDPWDLG